ncbi:unnamed protein product [marine sediment metagenome]|uniref:TFIIB-type domain-containing protein n=1 Tax=marine sediment metagenome TaxID=412755 RepID=X1I0G1_9ZZZZ
MRDKLPKYALRCPKCGGKDTIITDGSEYCNNCGLNLDEDGGGPKPDFS